MAHDVSRRHFLGVLSVGTGTLKLAPAAAAPTVWPPVNDKPALLGGRPVRKKPFPSWPVLGENDRRGLSEVLEGGRWNRGSSVLEFESQWAAKLGSPFALATSSGTSALYSSLYALGVGPGDEVIVPPYTFVATVNVVLLHHALPVFVDTDRKTFQMDASKLERAISDRTRCIVPVHLGGNMSDMDKIREISERHNLPVLEDACQAHLAEWKGKKSGTLGIAGCFSFQASKNLNSGEGGAVVSGDEEMIARCASFHNAGRPYAVTNGRLAGDESSGFAYVRNGDNRRLTEFQGSLLLSQMSRLEEQTALRERNAEYLTQQLSEINGISTAEQYPGCTRNAYHLYMFRYDPGHFSDLPRAQFLKAMRAEGVPCSGGYDPLNKEPFLRQTLESRGFRRIYGRGEFAAWQERNQCPENDRLCREAVWLLQTHLLAARDDMDQIATAIRKIQAHASELV